MAIDNKEFDPINMGLDPLDDGEEQAERTLRQIEVLMELDKGKN